MDAGPDTAFGDAALSGGSEDATAVAVWRRMAGCLASRLATVACASWPGQRRACFDFNGYRATLECAGHGGVIVLRCELPAVPATLQVMERMLACNLDDSCGELVFGMADDVPGVSVALPVELADGNEEAMVVQVLEVLLDAAKEVIA